MDKQYHNWCSFILMIAGIGFLAIGLDMVPGYNWIVNTFPFLSSNIGEYPTILVLGAGLAIFGLVVMYCSKETMAAEERGDHLRAAVCNECGKPLGKHVVTCKQCSKVFCSDACASQHRVSYHSRRVPDTTAIRERGRKRDAAKTILFLLLSASLFYLQLSGWTYAFYYSILLNSLALYDYNLPREFFGADTLRAFGLTRILLAIWTIGGCALNMIGGYLYMGASRALATGMAGFVWGSLSIDSVINAIGEFQTPGTIFWGVLLAGAFVKPEIRKRNQGYEEEIDRYFGVITTLFIFSFILGAGGQDTLGIVTGIIIAGYAVFSLSRSRRPKDIGKALKDVMRTRDTLEKTVWSAWLETGRGGFPQKRYLQGLLYLVAGYVIINVGFLDFTSTGQLLVIMLHGCSLLLAFDALKTQNLGWWQSLLVSIPAYMGLFFSALFPYVFPVSAYCIALAPSIPALMTFVNDLLPTVNAGINIFLASLCFSMLFYSWGNYMKWKGNRKRSILLAIAGSTVISTGAVIAASAFQLPGSRYLFPIGLAFVIFLSMAAVIRGGRSSIG